MEVLIRKVRLGDESALAHIQIESWRAAFEQILGRETLDRVLDPERAEKMYRSLLDEQKGNGYLLTLDGKPHCMAWWDAARDADMQGSAELICIHSLPDHWHSGYGGMMMERILGDIRDAGYPDVELWVFRDNIRARRFYEAYGFSVGEGSKSALGAEEVRYVKKF